MSGQQHSDPTRGHLSNAGMGMGSRNDGGVNPYGGLQLGAPYGHAPMQFQAPAGYGMNNHYASLMMPAHMSMFPAQGLPSEIGLLEDRMRGMNFHDPYAIPRDPTYDMLPPHDWEGQGGQRGRNLRGNNMGGSSYGQADNKRQPQQPKRTQKGMEDKIKRTVYISSIDHKVTEAALAEFFSECDTVLDCRICGGPHSAMRFAFIEFQTLAGVQAALEKTGSILSGLALRVLPSKTAIVPVSRDLMPRSMEDVERCGRTVYVANIDKKLERLDVYNFFEKLCGKISKLRLLGDHAHATRIAFIEFQDAEGAMAALYCSGAPLGSLPIRVSPSKTPVRPSNSSNQNKKDKSAEEGQEAGPSNVAPSAAAQEAGQEAQLAARGEQQELQGSSSGGAPATDLAPPQMVPSEELLSSELAAQMAALNTGQGLAL